MSLSSLTSSMPPGGWSRANGSLPPRRRVVDRDPGALCHAAHGGEALFSLARRTHYRGGLEIEPPANRQLPPPAPSYHRSWSASRRTCPQLNTRRRSRSSLAVMSTSTISTGAVVTNVVRIITRRERMKGSPMFRVTLGLVTAMFFGLAAASPASAGCCGSSWGGGGVVVGVVAGASTRGAAAVAATRATPIGSRSSFRRRSSNRGGCSAAGLRAGSAAAGHRAAVAAGSDLPAGGRGSGGALRR